jgi:hypothetical protein
MSKKDDDYIAEVKRKYQLAIDAEAENRMMWLEDMRFAHVPGSQWPNELRRSREDPTSPRPCIEINVMAQHVYQVVNDIRQNRPQVKVRPTAMDASNDVAEVYDGIIRHIDSCSDGDTATDTAANHAVSGGWGFFRIVTDYIDEESGEQEIYVKTVFNPLSATFDAASMCPVGSDAQCAFVVEDMPRKTFDAQYGKDAGQWEGNNDGYADWVTKETVRVCEYFERATREQNILILMDGSEMEESAYWEQYQGDAARPPIIANRTERENYVKWAKLTAFKVLEDGEFPSQYIPLIRVPGLIVDIDGKRYFKGLVRDAKDPQRVFNYQWSTFIETVALQPKVPFIGAEGQFDGHEAEWNQAHTSNLPYLEYKSTDSEGNQAGAPQRSQLQMAPQGVMQGLAMANDAIKMVTGQYDASLGQRSNETSGKAILARQHEGDVATYHFIDGLQMAIRHKGRILIDMIPRVYDTKRVMRILGEDGDTEEVRLDPDQPQAAQETQLMNGEISKIYNLNVGKYDVVATVGPSFSTKRQEAVDAMAQIMQGNPNIFPLIGDIWVRNQDWPGSDEISDRLKTMLPPQIKDSEKQGQQKIPPQALQQMQQMQQQMQQMGQAMQQMQQALKDAEAGNQAKIQTAQIDAEQRKQEAILQAQTDVEVAQIQMAAKAQIAKMEAEYKLQLELMKPQPQPTGFQQ